MDYPYEKFIRNNPDAMILAEKKLHPELSDKAYMRIYSYYWNNNYGYLFRYENMMVTNPLIFKIPIPDRLLPLFCYEWFLEYERISGVKEMFETDSDYFWTPNHLNSWDFAHKWEIRFGRLWKFSEGEHIRDYRKNEVYKHLNELKDNASKEELIELKKRLEEMIHVL